MASIRTMTVKLAAWRRYREALRELSRMSDHELADVGVSRGEIDRLARDTAKA